MSSKPTTLVPGYHQVESFGADEEYETNENGEIIEEVEYVTLDVGVVEPTLVPSSSAYRLIDLDTPSPFLQLSGTIFKGSHQELLGTELLFTDSTDESERAKKSLVHIGNTEKRIRFREVELKEKKPEIPAVPVGPNQYEQTNVNPKKRMPQTVEEIAGNLPAEDIPTRKGGRRGRKPKGKERETAVPNTQPTDTTEITHTSGGTQDSMLITQASTEAMDVTED